MRRDPSEFPANAPWLFPGIAEATLDPLAAGEGSPAIPERRQFQLDQPTRNGLDASPRNSANGTVYPAFD